MVLSTLHFVCDFYALFLPMFVPALVRQVGLSYFEASVLLAVMTLSNASLQAPIGYWADRYRWRVRVLALGFGLFLVGTVILGLSQAYWMLLLASALVGLGVGTYHPQSTTLLVKWFVRAGRALGVHGVGGQLGAFVAPLLVAALISWYGWRWAAVLLAVPAAAALVLVATFLSEPPGRGEAGFSRGLTRSLVLLIVVTGVRAAVFQGLVSFLPSFLTTRGFSLNASGLLTGLMLAVGVVAQPLGGTLGDRVSKTGMVCLSSVGLSIMVLLLHLSLRHPVAGGIGDYFRVLLPLVGAGFCIFLTFPVGLALAADMSPGERTGTSVGAVMGGGLILPAALLPVMGYLVDHTGFAGAMIFLSVVAGAGAILSLGLLRRTQAGEAVGTVAE